MTKNIQKWAKMTDLITGNMSDFAWIGCKNDMFCDIMHPFICQFGAFNTRLLEFSYENSNNICDMKCVPRK